MEYLLSKRGYMSKRELIEIIFDYIQLHGVKEFFEVVAIVVNELKD